MTIPRRTLLAGAAALAAGGATSLTLRAPAGAAGRSADAPTPPAAAPAGLYHPPAGSSWATRSPASAGFDPRGLERALRFAGEHASTGMVVLHCGLLVAERYWQGATLTRRRDIASCQKSVVSMLVDIAAAAGRLSLTDRVSRHLGSGWSAAGARNEARIQLLHLLSMTSGLDEDLRYLAPPGRTWSYNNAAYMLLHDVLAAATGRDLDGWSHAVLLDRIGATDARWYRRDGKAGEHAGEEGLAMTPRGMARVGLLALGAGRWERGWVVPEGRVPAETVPSQRVNPSYGRLWWLNGQRSFMLGQGGVSTPGSLLPTAPRDLFAALGKDDQKIYVVPSRSVVVVRQGGRAGREQLDFDRALWEILTPALPGH